MSVMVSPTTSDPLLPLPFQSAALREQVRRFQQQRRPPAVEASRYLEQLSRPKERALVENREGPLNFSVGIIYDFTPHNPRALPTPDTTHIFHGISQQGSCPYWGVWDFKWEQPGNGTHAGVGLIDGCPVLRRPAEKNRTGQASVFNTESSVVLRKSNRICTVAVTHAAQILCSGWEKSFGTPWTE